MIPNTSGFVLASRRARKNFRAFGVNDTAAFCGTNLNFRRGLFLDCDDGEVDANGDVFLLVPL